MFSKYKQQASIISTLTRTISRMYKYHQIWPIFSNLSISMLMHSQNHFWNHGSKNSTQMKPTHARWLISLYDKLRNSGEMIESIFENASIMEAIDNKDIPNEDTFKHLSE